MRRKSNQLMIAAILATGLAAGCGSESEQAAVPSGPTMSPGAKEAIRAREGNTPPDIASLMLIPSEPTAGEPVAATVVATDEDGDALTLRFEWSLNGTRLPAISDRLTPTDSLKGDLLELQVVANDGAALSVPFEHTVRIGNTAPHIESLSFHPPGEIRAGRTLRAEPTAQDRDRDALEFQYTWYVNGELAAGDGDSFATSELERGDTLEVRVVATDGEDYSDEFTSTPLRLTNAPPQIARETAKSSSEDGFVYVIPATDPDGDRMRFLLNEGPHGMEVSRTTGEVTWHPTAEQGGPHEIAIKVDDLHGGVVIHRFSLEVGVEQVAQAEASEPQAPAKLGE